MCTRKSYSTDLSDAQWEIIGPLTPSSKQGGRPPKYTRREIVNAILYVVRSGCGWTLMPHDLPNGKTAYHYFRLWRISALRSFLDRSGGIAHSSTCMACSASFLSCFTAASTTSRCQVVRLRNNASRTGGASPA